MKILDAGAYGIICPMVSNRKEAEKFVQACMYPPNGYRSYGPIRGLVYGGPEYADKANEEILKFAMIETKESLDNLDSIMQTPGLDGIYIGPADLSLAIGEKPSFDKPEGDPVYDVIMRILDHAKKNNIIAGIQNGEPEYAKKMIKKGFQLVTIGSDQRYMTGASKVALGKLKENQKTETVKGY
jgi:4-hydroxy-2-oxoheptanedioate aldolase